MENRELRIEKMESSNKPAKVTINCTLNKGSDRINVQIEADHASLNDMRNAQDAINDAFDDMFKEAFKQHRDEK
jgi:hypothetical protein